jgi:energy-coupling factor transport system substrate-specific component
MTEEPGSEHTHRDPPEGAGLEGEGYTAVVYTNQNGLPTSEANALAQTGEGFLWIGSYSGLIRYDGNTFERMSSSKTGISGVVELFVDSKGRLWIGSNDIGAAVYENGTFRVFNKEQGLPALYVKGISEDPDGNIYLGTSQGVVMVDSEMNIHPLDCSMMSDTNVMEMVYVSSGQIYGLTREGCLFVIEHGKVTQFLDTDKLGFKGAHAVYPDSEQKGFAFIGDDENTIRRGQVLGGSFHVEEEYSTGPLSGINSMYRIDDMLWISTDNGIGFCGTDILQC